MLKERKYKFEVERVFNDWLISDIVNDENLDIIDMIKFNCSDVAYHYSALAGLRGGVTLNRDSFRNIWYEKTESNNIARDFVSTTPKLTMTVDGFTRKEYLKLVRIAKKLTNMPYSYDRYHWHGWAICYLFSDISKRYPARSSDYTFKQSLVSYIDETTNTETVKLTIDINKKGGIDYFEVFYSIIHAPNKYNTKQ